MKFEFMESSKSSRILHGFITRTPINANPRLTVNQGLYFSYFIACLDKKFNLELDISQNQNWRTKITEIIIDNSRLAQTTFHSNLVNLRGTHLLNLVQRMSGTAAGPRRNQTLKPEVGGTPLY